jgi:hypothetical protein
MRTITTTAYLFNELSEEAKQKAINNLSDINVEHGWWDCTYEDAKEIGLKITSFDLYRNKGCSGKFIGDAHITANKIIENHGKECDTYITARDFQKDWDALVAKHSDGINISVVAEDKESEFDDEADDLEEEFLNSLLEDYANILQNEYDYLTSEEAIIETIEANEYEFDINGKLI